MTEQRLAAPAPLVTAYAELEWTAVSCYAEQTTWRLDRDGARARFVKVARAGAHPGLAAEADRTRWAFIRAAQAVGLTLGEIREVVALREHGQTPCTHVVALLERRADQIGQRIAELQHLQGDLRRLADRAQDLDPANCDARRVCHVIAPRRS